MKKMLSSIMTVFIITLIPNAITVSAAGSYEEQIQQEMKELHELGIVEKDDNSSAYLNEQLSRGEFASMIARSLVLPDGDASFFDVPETHPYYTDINKAASSGLINGIGQGKFAPDRTLTREEMVALVDRSIRLRGLNREITPLPFKDKDKIQLLWPVQHLYQWKIINGFPDNTFRPQDNVTRVQAAHTVYRMLGLLKEHELEKQRLEEEKQQREKEQREKERREREKREKEQREQEKREKERQQREEQEKEEANRPEQPSEPDEQQEEEQEEPRYQYDIAVIEAGKDLKKLATFKTYGEAKEELEQDEDQVILNNGEVFWMKGGMAVTKQFTRIYNEDMKQYMNYVAEGTELTFLEADEEKVKIKLVDNVGYVRHEDVVLIPEMMVGENRAYYKVQGGKLIHVIYRRTGFESYVYGKAPSFLKEGEQARSEDGVHFEDGVYYQYFNFLPLRTETSYSADDLDRYVEEMKPGSPLIGLGEAFKEAEEEHGVNALYLLSHAIHESAWGMSQVAQQKHNLYGIKAIDADPLKYATGFKDFDEGIDYAGNYIKTRYLTPGSVYGGGFLGNKGVGMNVNYASDPFWGKKIAGHMFRADSFLGGDDYGEYELAVVTVSGLNVREEPDTDADVLYTIERKGTTVVVLDEEENSEGTWFKIIPDDNDEEEGYIYADGKLGTFAKRINIE
ncbi:S-layer homology domain-containing protein [Bacillus tianshenii]|nr:S-layer homology domain-containing protein [Bacillus tianshenii]